MSEKEKQNLLSRIGDRIFPGQKIRREATDTLKNLLENYHKEDFIKEPILGCISPDFMGRHTYVSSVNVLYIKEGTLFERKNETAVNIGAFTPPRKTENHYDTEIPQEKFPEIVKKYNLTKDYLLDKFKQNHK